MGHDTKTRFSVSIAPGLIKELDDLVAARGFPSRSQAMAEIIQEHLTEVKAEPPDAEIVGTVTLVYDHHKRNLSTLLTEIQHDCHELIQSVLHVHVDHCVCMEVLAVSGPSASIRKMADRLIATKGVQHGKLAVTQIAGQGGCHRHHLSA